MFAVASTIVENKKKKKQFKGPIIEKPSCNYITSFRWTTCKHLKMMFTVSFEENGRCSYYGVK